MINKLKKSHSFKMDGTSPPKRKSPRSPKRKSPRSPKRKSSRSHSKSPPKSTLEDGTFEEECINLLNIFKNKIDEVVEMKATFLKTIVDEDMKEKFNDNMEEIMEDKLCKYTLYEERINDDNDDVRLIVIPDDSDIDIEDGKFKKIVKLMYMKDRFPG